MKKTLVFVNILLALCLIVSALPAVVFAEDAATETDYVRMTALGDDPYGTFTFSSTGANSQIDPDTVKWAVVRYRADASVVDTNGNQPIGQIFINPASEPYIAVEYEKFDGQWHSIVVDLTAVPASADEGTESNWTSAKYTAKSGIRFDPLSGNRILEKVNGLDKGAISEDSSIDIAYIAFFTSEDDANAYTGAESTPYCILTADSLSSASGANNLKLERVKDGSVVEQPKDAENYFLYDNTQNVATGWWMHPITEDSLITVSFETEEWFNAIWFTAYSSSVAYVYVTVYADSDIVYEGELTLYSNGDYSLDLGKACAPGEYEVEFMGEDNSDFDDSWFVLGSGYENEDVICEVSGGATNDSTRDVAAMWLKICEADPNAPTATPTAEPTATPAPTATPEPTEAPTAEPTATPEPAKSGCGSVISCSALVVLLAAAVVLKKKH